MLKGRKTEIKKSYLTHICPASYFWDIGKQHLIRVYTVCLQEFLFEIDDAKKKVYTKTENGLIQMIRMAKSTRHILVIFLFFSGNNGEMDVECFRASDFTEHICR